MTPVEEFRFEHLSIRILDLPFDLAQGGELVEPFRASDFEFRILCSVVDTHPILRDPKEITYGN